MKKESVQFLSQLVLSLDEAEAKLENAYGENNIENFNKAKKLILQINRKIAEVIK